MELTNIVDVLNSVWTILIAAGGLIIYKFIPYARTKISKYKYYNDIACFILLEYELIGTFVAFIVELLLAIDFEKSTWKKVIIEKNVQACIVVTLIYILGIFWIVRKKSEKKSISMCVFNIIFGGLIYITIVVQFVLILEDKYDNKDDYIYYLIVFGVAIVQVCANIIPRKVKSVKYIIITSDEAYITSCEPIKRGKYYFVKIIDEKKDVIKMVQLLEEKIEKIEYIVENLEENKNEKVIKERKQWGKLVKKYVDIFKRKSDKL